MLSAAGCSTQQMDCRAANLLFLALIFPILLFVLSVDPQNKNSFKQSF
jgi:hypothetical protein